MNPVRPVAIAGQTEWLSARNVGLGAFKDFTLRRVLSLDWIVVPGFDAALTAICAARNRMFELDYIH
jgi:hypothetical protein